MDIDDSNDAVPIVYYLHIIFSTRHQMPYLVDENIQEQMHERLSSIGDDMNCPRVIVSGSDDHVHLLIHGSADQSVDEMVTTLKSLSAAWLRERGGFFADFDWQESCVAFTESAEYVATVKGVLEGQSEFHKKVSFKRELAGILKAQDIEFDDELWE